MGDIEIYQSSDNQTKVEVRFEGETFWLSLTQIAGLFEKDKSVISRHLKNIFKDSELDRNSVVAKKATTAADNKTYIVEYYNLDAILSVGYRVNSKKGTQFRQWATQRLKDYLVRGYAHNQKRLDELRQTIELIGGKMEDLSDDGARGLLEIISKYTRSFILLHQFDRNDLRHAQLNEDITYEISHEEATAAISSLKQRLIAAGESSELFGNPKDDSFKSILGNIVQTFDGAYLYPSIEEQAAHLLYFVIKNHPFSDGNKRIGAFLFIWFLEKNKHRYKKTGELRINDNALTALALLVAQSNPSDKDILIALITNLLANAQPNE